MTHFCSYQVCHSRGLDTTDVDPEALVRWLADWVELSDAAGGEIIVSMVIPLPYTVKPLLSGSAIKSTPSITGTLKCLVLKLTSSCSPITNSYAADALY